MISMTEIEHIRLLVQDLERRVKSLEQTIGDPHHFVQFGETKWSMEHPIGCRTKSLFKCEVHDKLTAEMDKVEGPPVPPGRYRVTMSGGEEPLFFFSPAPSQ
jgi:hypothetical protein